MEGFLSAAPQPAHRRADQQGEGERQVVRQVPAAQPSRLAGQPEHPLQTCTLHPLGCAGQRLGRERDRRATTDEPGARERRGKASDQALLLGEPEPHVDDAGRRGRKPFIDRGDRLRIGIESDRWGVRPGYLQLRIQAAQFLSGLLRDARPAAQQVDRAPVAGGGLGEGEDKGRAGDPLRQRVTAEPRGPYQRHAVRYDQRRSGQ